MLMALAIHKPALGKAATAFLGRKHRMLVDGKWVEARSGETFPVEDPATQEIVGQVPAGDKADIDQAVAAARRAFDSGPWSRLSPADRSRLVWTLGDLLEKHADEFAQLEALDTASRSRTRAVTTSAARLPCFVTWPAGQRDLVAKPFPSLHPATGMLRARTRIFESRNGEGIPSVTQRE
jgi:acyl-CoA reductase-like NAD-dependent aldehyde dehydrogenase